MTGLSRICFDVEPHVARQVKRQPDTIVRLALLTSYFAQQAAGEHPQSVEVTDEGVRVLETEAADTSVVEPLPTTRAGERTPLLDPAGLAVAVDRAIAAAGRELGVEEAALEAPSLINCVTLLEALERQLYPPLAVGPGLLPPTSAVRAAVTQDDLAVGSSNPEQRLARGPGWGPVTSWRDLAAAVADAGPGATGLVVTRRRRGPGHAFALHLTSGGIRWIELQSKSRRVVEEHPDGEPFDTRAVVVDPYGRVVLHGMDNQTTEASRQVDALTDPPAQPHAVGAIGEEVEDRHVLGGRLAAKTVLAEHDSGVKLVVDREVFYRGTDGGLYNSADQARAVPGNDVIREENRPIVEIVGPPLAVLAGDVGRLSVQTGRSVRRTVRQALNQTDWQGRAIPLGQLLRNIPGWRVKSIARDVPVEPSPAGPNHPAYTQFTVGVAAGGLKHILHVAEARIAYPDLAPLMASGRGFGDIVAARYASAVLQRPVSPDDIPFLTEFAGVDEVHGYAWLVYLHAAASPVLDRFFMDTFGLSKNMLIVALRNPFHVLRAALSPSVARYLSVDTPAIIRAFEGHLRGLVAQYSASGFGSVGDEDLMETGIDQHSLTDYLIYTLRGHTPSGHTVSQNDVFGLQDYPALDTNGQRYRVPAALLEMRDFAAEPAQRVPGWQPTDMTDDAIDASFDQLASSAVEANRLAERFRPGGVPGLSASTAAAVLEHPLIPAVRGLFAELNGLLRPGPMGQVPIAPLATRAYTMASVARHLAAGTAPPQAVVQGMVAVHQEVLRMLNSRTQMPGELRSRLQRAASYGDQALRGIQSLTRHAPTQAVASGSRHHGAQQGHSSGWGAGEPPTVFGEPVQEPSSAHGSADWYAPLPESTVGELAARLIHVPDQVEQPVAARLELTRLLSLVFAHPDAVARVENILVGAGDATRRITGIHIVPRNTPLPEYMSAIGVDPALHTHDGRSADALRSVADLHHQVVFVAEENLLGEKTTYENAPAPHPDGYSSVLHELAHYLYTFGLGDEDRSLVEEVHGERMGAGNEIPWVDGPRLDLHGEPVDNYASQNPEEFFAQLTNAYFGANAGNDPLTGRARNNGAAWIEANEPRIHALLHRQYGDSAPLNPYNPVGRTSAENDLWRGYREFTGLTENTAVDRPAPDATDQAATVRAGVTTAAEERSATQDVATVHYEADDREERHVLAGPETREDGRQDVEPVRTGSTGERVETDSWLGSVEGEPIPRAASPEPAEHESLSTRAHSGRKPSLTLDVAVPSVTHASSPQSPRSAYLALVSPIDTTRSHFGLVRTPEGPLQSPIRLIRTPLTARPEAYSVPWSSPGVHDVPTEAEEENGRPLDETALTSAAAIQILSGWIEGDIEVTARGRLGADLFGLHTPSPTPEFLVDPESNAPYDFRSLDTDQSSHFLHLMDMRGHATPPLMDPQAWNDVTGKYSLGRAQDPLEATEVADAPFPPDRQVRTPLLVHAIWLGGPLRESGPSAGFWSRFGDAAKRLNGEALFALWTDVPRYQIQEVMNLSATPEDPVLAQVWGMVEWARINGVKLLDVHEVFNESAPMELHDHFMVESGKAVGTGWAAASDILRLEILDRFGGLYSDGDNVIKDLSSLHQVTQSEEGYAIAATTKFFSNAAVAVTSKNAFPGIAKSIIASNYQKSQVELIGRGGAAASNDFWTRGPGRSKRHSVIVRTGPDAYVGMLDRLGLERTTDMPRLRGIDVRSDFSWSAEEQARKDAAVPANVYTAEDTMRVVAGVVQTMVRSLLNRQGDLHLTQIEPVVRRHQDPDFVWESAFGFLASREELRSLVRGVTRTTYLGNGDFYRVELPQTVESLLLTPEEHSAAPLGNAEGWWLGEQSTPVELAPSPLAFDHPAVSDADTRTDLPAASYSSELLDDLASRVRRELERLGRTDLSIGAEDVADYFGRTQESADAGPRGHLAGRMAGWFANDGQHVAEPSTESGQSTESAGRALRDAEATSRAPREPGLVAFLDAPRGNAGPARGDEVVEQGSDPVVTAAPKAVGPLSSAHHPRHREESAEVGSEPETHRTEVSSAKRRVDDLVEQFKEDVRPALRVWDRPVSYEIQALKGILGSPGARSLVFGLDADGPVWAVNMGGTLTWLTNVLVPLSPPEVVDGPVISIDIDSHGQLTGPAEQNLREHGITLSDGVKTGFCDLNFGTDIGKVTGWKA
ncbi:toxin glutamine deamidase domain-containing protein [Streptomyces sp. NBC_00178]|uniref:toxin glutamine deamidase domain-containing protein n=1 Tax=Streptomyces sp. NBC_00178 TaxID=2975672 RepID=UPI002E29A329|nr:toxin glutamine deamidase domain-containing protein [Streptomyces sp. NBC_00178]